MVQAFLFVIITAIVVSPNNFREAVSLLFDSIGRCAQHCDRLVISAFTAMRSWWRVRPTCQPVPTMLGLILLGAAVPVNIADYSVLRMSVPLIWPTDSPPMYLPISMVLLTISLGVLLHTLKGTWCRVIIAGLVLALVICQASIAWYRTQQLNQIRATELAAQAASEDLGTLVMQSEQASTLSGSDRSPNHTVSGHASESVSAVLALLLCLGSLTVTWGGLTLGAPGLVWLFFLPVLVPIWLLFTLVHAFAKLRLHAGVAALVLGVLDAVAEIEHGIARTVRLILPVCWTIESFHWGRDFQDRKHALQQQREMSKEFAEAQAQFRVNMFRELMGCAAITARQQIADIAQHLVSLWFSPVRRLLKLNNVLTPALTGESSEEGH